ncbi:hypothetical protein ASG54_15875 [Aureimonas sp. Leaf460]|uniref:hypothetical protein n=2 Tax=unclassified Aureimonas TaxID=2615206 RepID=UPI0006F4336D|nr:hypothetical protein [Aureimonas sp. Leaf460]KQT65131.1 hypothetical protein ASG62_22300 [Aureimonas sp. Leaf427]KQT76219.1 hypothetical protein ASG54_15875 [Aureimonas sp. Leaf460]
MVDLMPQLFLFGLVGAAAYYGFNRLKGEAVRLADRNRRSEQELRTGAQGTLVRGEDGVYRLKRD